MRWETLPLSTKGAVMKKINSLILLCEGTATILAATLAYFLRGNALASLSLAGLSIIIAALFILRLCAIKNPKLAKTLSRIFIILLGFGILLFIAVEIPIIAGAQTDEKPEADYVIVLGAGLNGETPSLVLTERLRAARDYLENYPDAKVVVSGGQGPGETITEAESMRRWLEQAGIAPERILKEDKSTSTQENLSFSLDVIAADGGDTEGEIAVLSSEFHLYRAKFVARSLGFEPLGVAAATSYPLMKIGYFIREAFAVLGYWIM